MIRAYINNNIAIDQIDKIYSEGIFENKKIGKYYFDDTRNDVAKNSHNELSIIIDDAEDGDIILTSTLANFSTGFPVICRTIRLLTEKGVRVVATLENFDTDNEEGKIFLKAMPILQRINKTCGRARMISQQSGIAKAKEAGKYTGRKAKTLNDYEEFEKYYILYMSREINKGEFAENIGVSRPTLEKLIKERRSATL